MNKHRRCLISVEKKEKRKKDPRRGSISKINKHLSKNKIIN